VIANTTNHCDLKKIMLKDASIPDDTIQSVSVNYAFAVAVMKIVNQCSNAAYCITTIIPPGGQKG
jgi:hypothetical protein